MSGYDFPDPSEFPQDVRAAYERIKKRCPVTVEPVALDGQQYRLLMVQDITALVDGDPFADPSRFPTWTKLWEASLLLACYVKRLSLPLGTRVLELGAGTGLPSMVAAGTGCRVTASDYDPLVCDFLRVNAHLNDLSYEILQMDWLAPSVSCRYDVILAAEVVFKEELFPPLLGVFESVLAPGGTIYLAHDASRRSVPPFLQQASATFNIAAMQQTITKDPETSFTVLLHRLQKKEP